MKSSNRQMLTFMPLRSGLATAGKRSTVEESQLWVAENVYPDLDGMLLSRPGLVQWGQTLTAPAPTATNSFYEPFADLTGWELLSADTVNSVTSSLGKLVISMASASTSTARLSRSAANDSSTGNYSCKFVCRLTNPDGVDTTGGSLKIRLSGNSGTTVHEYVFTADGVSVTGIATPIYTPEYKLDLGGPHAYEIYYTSSGSTVRIGFDGTVGAAISMAGATNVGFTGATCNTVEIVATLDSTEDAWTATITDLQYCDKVYASDDLPFVAQSIVDTGQYKRALRGGSTKNILLAATSSYLYADIGQLGAWQPVMSVLPGHTFFLAFQDVLLIFDDNGQNNARLFEWNGVDAPTQVLDAPPVRFGTVHRTRLFSAGDREFPNRLYYTASRRHKVWFAPEYDSDETFDEVMNAGYLLIPTETGEEITGVYGEFFGSLIVQTSKGLWRVTGSSAASFRIENISKRIGGAAPCGMVQLGNDLFGVGKSGVFSAQNAATSGEFQTGLPSGPIADKWSSLPSIAGRVDRQQLYHSYFVTMPSLNIAVLGMRGQGSTTLDQTMVFSPVLNMWVGPWSNNATCFSSVDIGTPEEEVLLEGHEDGRVMVTGLSAMDDAGELFTATIESALINGRSVDPALMDSRKSWRTLRLYLLPRANETLTVTWWTDNDAEQSTTISQDPDNGPGLSDDYILDDSLLSDPEYVATVDITLDAKGQYLAYRISSDYPLAFQGCQVEFMPGD